MLEFQPLSELQSELNSWEPKSLDCLHQVIPAFGIISLTNPDSTSLETVDTFVDQQSIQPLSGSENPDKGSSIETHNTDDSLPPIDQFYIHTLDQVALKLSEASEETLAQTLIQLQEWSLFLYHIKTPPSITTIKYLEILESRSRKLTINSECARTLYSWKCHYQLSDLRLMPAIGNLLVGSERTLANHFHEYWMNWGETDSVGETSVREPIFKSFESVNLERTGLLAADTMEGTPFKAEFKKLGLKMNFSSDGHYVQVDMDKNTSLVKGILSIELTYGVNSSGTLKETRKFIAGNKLSSQNIAPRWFVDNSKPQPINLPSVNQSAQALVIFIDQNNSLRQAEATISATPLW